MQGHLISIRALALGGLVALVAACGGGSDATGPIFGTPTFPPLSQDVEPPGARIDVAGRDYFALDAGNHWTFAALLSNGDPGAIVTRRVEGPPDAAGYLNVIEDDGEEVTEQQRVTAQGLESRDPTGSGDSAWPGVLAALPTYVEIPTPFYPIGGTRQTIRQGDMQADVDGDNVSDSFRLVVTQVFVGFQSISVFGQPREVAHFRTTVELSIAGTATDKTQTVTGTEDMYLADGLGPVRIDREASTSDGSVVVLPQTLELQSAVIKGVTFPSGS